MRSSSEAGGYWGGLWSLWDGCCKNRNDEPVRSPARIAFERQVHVDRTGWGLQDVERTTNLNPKGSSNFALACPAVQNLEKPGAAGISETPELFSKQDASSNICQVALVFRCQMFVVTTGTVNASSS
jgi:hypothetical protein